MRAQHKSSCDAAWNVAEGGRGATSLDSSEAVAGLSVMMMVVVVMCERGVVVMEVVYERGVTELMV